MGREIRKEIRKDLEKNNKGFTLVELIVVLVILAILAAILVPALLGYIDRAKSSQDILNARKLYTAAQTVASEYYAKGKTIDFGSNGGSGYSEEVLKISDLTKEDFAYGFIGFEKNNLDPHAKCTVAVVVYYNTKGEVYYMETGTAWKNCVAGDFDLHVEFGDKYDWAWIFHFDPSAP